MKTIFSFYNPLNLQCTTSTVSNGMSLSNALANLEGDNELPLGQATPLLEEEACGNSGKGLFINDVITLGGDRDAPPPPPPPPL